MTKAFTACACSRRLASEERFGGWWCEVRPSSPPFEPKWLAITKTVRPRKVNSPASGLRLLSQAVFAGSIRPGESVRAARPFSATTPVAVCRVAARAVGEGDPLAG